jgi:hypothetical protein
LRLGNPFNPLLSLEAGWVPDLDDFIELKAGFNQNLVLVLSPIKHMFT